MGIPQVRHPESVPATTAPYPKGYARHGFSQKYLDDWKTCRNFAAEYSRKYVFIMATVVLQVPDESLVSKVKSACKMLVGVASVKGLKTPKEKDYDITKTAGYREAMDDVKNGRVYHYDSLKDFYKEMGL